MASNPVIDSLVGGSIWFGDGPCKSLEDAKLARSAIRVFPKDED